MNEELQNIIQNSNFDIQEGRYIYTQVKSVDPNKDYFMVTKDKDEITIVTREEDLEDLDLIEKNKDFYRLIALNVSIPFYSVGFLSTVSSAIADQGINVLIVSTYSKDYIMVKDDCLEKAKSALMGLGFKN